jgi:hypothetical protein
MPTLRQSLGHGRSAYAGWLVPRGSTLTSTRPALSALYETLVHWFNQDWTTILRTPMIFGAEYATCIFAALTHQQEYTKHTRLRQTKSEYTKKDRIPLRQNLWQQGRSLQKP